MTCECITQVNEMLAERNTRLRLPITLTALSDPAEPQRLLVEAQQIEKGRGKAKAVAVFATYCPFCGKIYKEE